MSKAFNDQFRSSDDEEVFNIAELLYSTHVVATSTALLAGQGLTGGACSLRAQGENGELGQPRQICHSHQMGSLRGPRRTGLLAAAGCNAAVLKCSRDGGCGAASPDGGVRKME
eukprot:2398458-Amphidinium_carterae.4